MKLNKNNAPYYVTGTELTYSRLKTMTKDKLIEYLCTAQFNYESINERLYNMSQYAERLDKALDMASDIIYNLNHCSNIDYPTCPFRKDCANGTVKSCLATEEYWKKYLLESVK